MANIYKNTVGLRIRIDVGIPDNEISLAKIYLKKPDGSVVEKNAQKEVGSTIIYYETQEGDLNLEGRYSVQPYIETTTGFKGRGAVNYFDVGVAI